MWNCLWGHALNRSHGINRKSRVLYPGPGFLSSATWSSMPKKHYNGLINQPAFPQYIMEKKPALLKNELQWNSSCEANSFVPEKMAFQEGWPLVRGRKQHIHVYIYLVKWPFQRGWPLKRGSTVNNLCCPSGKNAVV